MEVIRRIRANPVLEDLPIIVITVKTTDSDVFDGYHVGCDIYLKKPLDPDDLLPLFAC